MTKGILFNTEMVKAILEGRKTVTRRIIKRDLLNCCDFDTDGTICGYCDKDGDWYEIEDFAPYNIGDILYVRETWKRIPGASSKGGFAYKYKASEEGRYWDKVYGFKWKPSIHMPKEAARIWLKVTNVRVERLQDIDGQGIAREGVDNGKSNPSMGVRWENMQRMAFEKLWNSTIKKPDLERYGWAANPYVWIFEFERIEKGDI